MPLSGPTKCSAPKTIFVCEVCAYNTNRKSQYDRHILSLKHNRLTNTDFFSSKCSAPLEFKCICGKNYKHKQSLYNHKKKCEFLLDKIEDADKQDNPDKRENTANINNITNEENITNQANTTNITNIENIENKIIDNDDKDINYKEMFLTMINENKELRRVIKELIPNVGNNNNSYNTVNNKQRFNINVFLNEQCKDALTMNQFIDQIKITIEDLMYTKNKGISAGVSNLFIKNMNKLSLYERPIHCTDTKRETVYIKSDAEEGDSSGQWEKDIEKEKLKKAISTMTLVQSKNLNLYTEANPDWMDKEDKQNEYVLMMRECMDDIKKDNRTDKVVKKLCNTVYINGDEVK